MKEMQKKDFFWNTVGSLIFGFTSLIYMIIITRVNSIENAGVFTYAFACASVFWTIGTYCGKTYQVTERNSKITDSDYLYNRLFTCILMNLCAVIFCLITRPGSLKMVMIIVLTMYRSIDSFIESIHAIVQRNKELYKVGISLFIRTIILVVSFTVIDYLTKNMVTSTLCLVLVNFFFCVIVDFQNIKGKYTRSKFNYRTNNTLLKAGFAAFCYSFLSIYVINAAKYAMNNYSTDELQAIFGIIIMPASFLAMISTYLVQPFLNTITEKLKNNQIKELKSLLYKLMIGIIGIGMLAILVCYIIGIPILEIVYGIKLDNQLNNLIIVLVGSILYSLAIVMSSIFVAMRKTGSQLLVLIITALVSLGIYPYFIIHKGIEGASLAYTIVMMIEALLHYVTLMYHMNAKGKKVEIRLMGGLGNQMFEYCALRSFMLEHRLAGEISLKGITNKTHNVYFLDHFQISKEVRVKESETLKSKINHLIYGFYCVFLVKKKNGFAIMNKLQRLLNYFGIYCVPDGYMKLYDSTSNHQSLVGYFQSHKYFDKYRDVLIKELKVQDKVLDRNKKLLEEIQKNNSVCVHIRRGDYVGSNHQVCTPAYYKKAVSIMKKKVFKAKFYVFSDDINWVKENLDLGVKVTYIEGNNPNYEELRLMYSCKHFIISNSSFSWWAQYLTENKERITIAPSKWFQNKNQKVDIYQDDWILIDVEDIK